MTTEIRLCGQKCGKPATTYAMDPHPGGWAGYYCDECCAALRFSPVGPRLPEPEPEPEPFDTALSRHTAQAIEAITNPGGAR